MTEGSFHIQVQAWQLKKCCIEHLQTGFEGIDVSVEKLCFLECLFIPYSRPLPIVRLQMQEAVKAVFVVFRIQKFTEWKKMTEYDNSFALVTQWYPVTGSAVGTNSNCSNCLFLAACSWESISGKITLKHFSK